MEKSLVEALIPETFQNPFLIDANTGETKWRMCLDLGWWITHCDNGYSLIQMTR
jgi:hypothetical protein